MSTNEERRSTSMGKLVKPPSGDPPSLRSSNRKMKSSKSVISMRSSQIPPTESVDSEKHLEVAEKKKPEDGKTNSSIDNSTFLVPRECNCVPDLYTRVLGPTADETILTGLQTVIDLCSRLRTCGDGDESAEEEPEKEQVNSSLYQEVPVKDISVRSKSSNSPTPYHSVSAAFQVTPSVKTAATQSLPYPQMVSEILQTVGLTPETVSKIMQTSFPELTEPKKPSLTSMKIQTSNATLRSNFMQTSFPDYTLDTVQTGSDLLLKVKAPVLESVNTQKDLDKVPTDNVSTQSDFGSTDDVMTQSDSIKTESKMTMPDEGSLLLPPVREKSIQSDVISAVREKSIQSDVISVGKGDEHKCISPPEPPDEPEQPSLNCKCCACSSSTSRTSKSSITKKTCVCGKRKSKCKCSKFKRSNTHMETGTRQSALEVKYAVTKISKYKEFTTYEVLKSTKNKPRQIPKGIEGVFVLKKKGGSDGELKLAKNGNGIKNGKISRGKNGSAEI